MAVDHRLDLFRMHLQPADIDDAAAAADEIIAVAAQLDHVAGVDEAVGVASAAACRRDSASAVRGERMRSEPSIDLHLDAARPSPIRIAGKPARARR